MVIVPTVPSSPSSRLRRLDSKGKINRTLFSLLTPSPWGSIVCRNYQKVHGMFDSNLDTVLMLKDTGDHRVEM